MPGGILSGAFEQSRTAAGDARQRHLPRPGEPPAGAAHAQGQAADRRAEARQRARGLPQKARQETARRLRTPSPQTLRPQSQAQLCSRTLQITLTPQTLKELHHKHKLKLELHITYTPAGGTSASTTDVTITLKP
ncbi:MAG TPA: hypothetical protein VID48_09380 [Solirubrobacteraceae bacterium]